MTKEKTTSKMTPTKIISMRETEDDEIDLMDLAQMYLDHIVVIAAAMIICAIVAGCYAYFCITPTYQSTAKLYIVSSSSDSVVDLTDLNIGTSLKSDYQELIMSYPVLDQVSEKLNLGLTSDELAEKISITNPDDTRVLSLTATATSPEEARDIANTLAEVSVDYLPKTMNTDAPNIAQEARLEEAKVAPSYKKYVMLGALLGLILTCGFFTVGYLMDDTIHTQEDMEKYFGVVPLTVIPENKSLVDENADKKTEKKSFFRRRKAG